MTVDVLPMCPCATYMQCPQRPEKRVRSPEAEVRDGCEVSCGFWEPNPDPLAGTSVLLTAEKSSSPYRIFSIVTPLSISQLIEFFLFKNLPLVSLELTEIKFKDHNTEVGETVHQVRVLAE